MCSWLSPGCADRAALACGDRLKGSFGLDPPQLRERFAFDFERFPVRAEG